MKSAYLPTNKDLAGEIARRSYFFEKDLPHTDEHPLIGKKILPKAKARPMESKAVNNLVM